MNKLKYPYDAQNILKKKKSIKKELISTKTDFIQKRVAVLGGSTTHEIVKCLELFLLNEGIEPTFYESEYAMYYEDAMFDNDELKEFAPDIIYIHTNNRNITQYPHLTDSADYIDELLNNELNKFTQMWESIRTKYNCPIIQNNFELPFYRILGNKDASDIHGKVNFITRLNMKFYEFAQQNDNFYINDINYLSANFGLEEWSNPFYWNMYKYALCMQAIPSLSHSVSNIIKSIYGKNKKAFALDLDNTLWGGIIGDDGVAGIELGPETSIGQAYSEFQKYLIECKDLGIILNVISKNEHDNAILGLNHEYSLIKPEDCIVIKANWEPKSQNLAEIIDEVSLTSSGFVFVDDNPAERDIVKQNFSDVSVPEIDSVENYIKFIDRAGYFEVTNLSKDDLTRNQMYKENKVRQNLQQSFVNYRDYLLSLEMKATIKPFEEQYMSRITQLTNKSNQFNLTTKRYTQDEIETVAIDKSKITLYGKLVDKFGDNGVVSVVIGDIRNDELHIDLWLMSCRVLKRDMEFAMFDTLIKECNRQGISKVYGYYIKSAKNNMVVDFYDKQGFNQISKTNDDTIWEYCIENQYSCKNKVITVN